MNTKRQPLIVPGSVVKKPQEGEQIFSSFCKSGNGLIRGDLAVLPQVIVVTNDEDDP